MDIKEDLRFNQLAYRWEFLARMPIATI